MRSNRGGRGFRRPVCNRHAGASQRVEGRQLVETRVRSRILSHRCIISLLTTFNTILSIFFNPHSLEQKVCSAIRSIRIFLKSPSAPLCQRR